MKTINILIFTLFIFGCKPEIEIKPMKYEKGSKHYDCDGYFKNDSLFKAVCYSEKRDTILKDLFVNGVLNGNSIEYFESGKQKKEGNYINGRKANIWREYYENGKLKSYRFYNTELDSFNLFYEKTYDSTGILATLRYPLNYKTNLLKGGNYKVGKTYNLHIELEYTEYDSIYAAAYLNQSLASGIEADTILYEGNTVEIAFTPLEKGLHTISGLFLEFDKSKEKFDDGFGGEREFSFEYEAIE